jgi:hypothetical protein
MTKIVSLICLLALWSAVVSAGLLVEGVCSNCGYRSDSLALGTGETPYRENFLYYSPDWKVVMVVGFDYAAMFVNLLGIDLSEEGCSDEEEFVRQHIDEFDAMLQDFSPPEEITADLSLPFTEISSLYADRGRPPLLILYNNIWQGEHTCPNCGEQTLTFEMAGKWD